MNVLTHLKEALEQYLVSSFSLEPSVLDTHLFSLNTDESKQSFGDISSNCAMILAKQLKMQPRALAEKIKQEFSHPAIEKIEIAGPGFINMWFTQHSYITLAQTLYDQDNSFFKLEEKTKRHNYDIEFVSANPTGPLHLGHGRGGIIGDVLGNILTFLGHKATKEFYINDAGNQIQKLGTSFKARCMQALGQKAEIPEDGYQGEYLKTLADECIKEMGPSILEKPNQFFDQYAKNHLLEKIQHTLKEYGIHFDVWFSEKTLHESGAIEKSIDTLKQNGTTFEQDGALWFRSTTYGDDKDRVIRKASGEYTYAAADIAYLENKISRGFDKLIIILGQDHHSYKQRLAGILQALGYPASLLEVILYQLVTLKESGELVKMSKRAGRIVSLEDIIETVGKDVARFFYLNRKADAHLDFDLELALKRTDENPVYYIQYAYVRINSIIEKSHSVEGLASIGVHDAESLGQSEYLLLKKIMSLKTILESISHTYQTHTLTYYVLELAQLFHSYYAGNRVIELTNIPQSRARILMIIIVRNTLKTCLNLLGLSAPEKM